MAGRRRKRKIKWITPDQADARRAQGFEGKHRRRERTLFSIIFSFVLVCLLFGSIILYLFQERLKEAPSSIDISHIEDPYLRQLELEFKTPSVKWTGKLPTEILNEFRNADTVEEHLQHLDHLDEVESEAREFFTNGPGSHEIIAKIKKLRPIVGADTETYLQIRLVMESGTTRMIYMRHSPSGPKIDFRAYSRSGSHSWDDILNGKVDEAPEMRLALHKDNFYLGEFQDDSVWQSLRGTSPDIEEHLSLYIKKDQLSDISKQVFDGNYRILATVSLRKIGESHRRKQFEIKKIHQLNWLSLSPEPK